MSLGLSDTLDIVCYETGDAVMDELKNIFSGVGGNIKKIGNAKAISSGDIIVANYAAAKALGDKNKLELLESEMPIFFVASVLDEKNQIFGFYQKSLQTFCAKLRGV